MGHIGNRKFKNDVTFDGYQTLNNEGYSDDHLVTKGYVDGRLVSQDVGFEIYVDPTGHDGASGASGDPVATIYEASKRAKGNDIVRLSAGTHVLTEHGWFAYTRNLFQGSNLQVKGATSIESTFTVDSWTDNVVTAQGTPGWTIDEHIGKRIRWLPYGPYEDFYFGFIVLSNTADTMTVAASVSSLGGTTSIPGNGVVVDIAINASKIVAPSGGTNAPDRLYYDGVVTFYNIDFDGSVNSAAQGAAGWSPGAEGAFRYCDFNDFSYAGISATGQVQAGNCLFDSCDIGVVAGAYSILNPDNVMMDCTYGIQGIQGVVFVNHGCLGWYVNTSVCQWIEAAATHDDGTIANWIDGTVTTYARVAEGGNLLKTAYAVIGVTGKLTFVGPVIDLPGRNSVADVFNSDNTNVLPDASYFRVQGDLFALSEHIGKSTEFLDNNYILG